MDTIAGVLERYLIENTQRVSSRFPTPEGLADCVDLSIAYSPILLPGRWFPHKVAKLGNEKFAIYDVGYPRANMGNHAWNVEAAELREHRARFLIQRDLFHQDLIMDSDNSLQFYRWWTGGLLHEPKWTIRQHLVPHFLQKGAFIPDKTSNPIGRHVAQHYVYADGSIEVNPFRY